MYGIDKFFTKGAVYTKTNMNRIFSCFYVYITRSLSCSLLYHRGYQLYYGRILHILICSITFLILGCHILSFSSVFLGSLQCLTIAVISVKSYINIVSCRYCRYYLKVSYYTEVIYRRHIHWISHCNHYLVYSIGNKSVGYHRMFSKNTFIYESNYIVGNVNSRKIHILKPKLGRKRFCYSLLCNKA